ncbi:MAG TPA: YbhN family protein, partial [Acidimicrobiales bacterium]|nr:YbhN family protein [Acidimicrobiales bacterium]
FVAASISLAIVAAVGVAMADPSGDAFDLTGVTIVVLAVTLVVGVLFVQRDALIWVVRTGLRGLRRLTGFPRGDLGASVDHVIGRLTVVGFRPLQALAVLGYALANWVFDCACLVCCFAAVGAPVPWRGLLLAYGAGQLAANLPITPGGLGVVEGSITIALSYFGGSEPAAIAAVLLYRILSFWAELPIGWGVWAGLAWARRRSPVAVPAGVGTAGEAATAAADGVAEVTA